MENVTGSASGKSIKRASGRIKGYCCCKYISQGLSACRASEVPEELILAHFKEFLKNTLVTYREVINTIQIHSIKDKKEDLQVTLKQQQTRLEQEISMLISERIKDLVASQDNATKELISKTYKELEENKKRELLEISKKLEELQTATKESVKKEITNAIALYEKILTFDVPPYYLLEQVLDKIYLYRDKSISFELKVNIEDLCV